jgi:nicotinamide-nucleotide amidase
MNAAIATLKQLMRSAPALTLAAAESMTCGRVQAEIGAISGASTFFLGGITAYTLEEKVRHLGVTRAPAKKANAVSARVAEEMARGVCALFGSDLGVATTGYAEPSPGDGVIAPFAFWALAHRRRGRWFAERGGRVECPGAKRGEAQAMVAAAVVAELVAYLEELRRAP